VQDVYAGWRYPEEWITEAYSLESPKLFRRGEYFYLVTAVGGTAGPPTGHMVIVARSKSIDGPWENSPHNPVVRTVRDVEPWWSRGHGTIFEGPGGQWWLVYHAFENGFRTLGRQTLLEPIEWTRDGWPRATGGDGGGPIRAPRVTAAPSPAGFPRSDDFSSGTLSPRWVFYGPGPAEAERARFEGGALVLAGKGASPAETSPLTSSVGDHAYEATVKAELVGVAQAGLLLFLCNRLFLGLGFDGEAMTTYAGGRVHHFRERAPASRTMHLRIVNDRHIITFYYSLDGQSWTRHGLRLEASGYHVNTIVPGEGESLRPALFATGGGSVRFSDYRYRALA
jgi:xylan 1,4-beta-xylosidase